MHLLGGDSRSEATGVTTRKKSQPEHPGRARRRRSAARAVAEGAQPLQCRLSGSKPRRKSSSACTYSSPHCPSGVQHAGPSSAALQQLSCSRQSSVHIAQGVSGEQPGPHLPLQSSASTVTSRSSVVPLRLSKETLSVLPRSTHSTPSSARDLSTLEPGACAGAGCPASSR